MTSQAAELKVQSLSVDFHVGGGLFQRGARLRAVSDVSFDLAPGRALGVVGESGCGKSTLARAILRLERASAGRIFWGEREISAMSDAEFRPLRPALQMIFQDPLASLNPRMKVSEIIAEPLRTHRPDLSRAERAAMVREAMQKVGLSPDMAERFPHEFSGGQAQRIGIARAIVLSPGLLICDEAVSALDVSIQAQVLKLLRDLRNDLGLGLLFISHDLAVVQSLCDEILVLYLGTVVEQGPSETVFASPKHPYTAALIGSILSADPRVERSHRAPPIGGDMPSPLNPPKGCAFNTRCPLAEPICRREKPALRQHPDGAFVACHLRSRELDPLPATESSGDV